MTTMAQTTSRRTTVLARFLTEVVEPKVVILAICSLVCIGHYGLAGIGWAAITIGFAAVLPLLFIRKVVQRDGRGWAQRHLSDVQLRIAVIPVILALVAAGFVLLVVLGAPLEVKALMAAMLATLLAVFLVTKAWTWKISGHTSVYSGAVMIAAISFGPWWLAALPLVVLVGWARTHLRDHTVAEVICGSILGAVVAGSVFSVLR